MRRQGLRVFFMHRGCSTDIAPAKQAKRSSLLRKAQEADAREIN